MRTSDALKEELHKEIQNRDPDETDSPSENVVRIAHEVYDLLPAEYLTDNIYTDLTGYGSINISWCLGSRAYFEILIENTPRELERNSDGSFAQVISYVWRNRGERGSGDSHWYGQLPHGLLITLDWVVRSNIEYRI